MILTNLMDAILYQYNRNNSNSPYTDEDKQSVNIKVCPYNVDQAIKFGIQTVPEATGYYIVKGNIDIKEGDQIVFNDKTHTVLKVADNWIFNKVVNISVAVK